MKTQLNFIALAILTLPLCVTAQGTTYFSNGGVSSDGHVNVGSDSWGAAWFQTGSAASGYTLESIQLFMGDTAGSPSGFSAMLWNFQTGQPILTLTGPNPTTAGIYTFSASSFVMPPNKVYWFVATSQTPTAGGGFTWAYTSQNVLGNPWLGGGYQVSIDGLNWTRESGREFQFAVNAQLIPEPSSHTLVALGSIVVAALGRMYARTKTPKSKETNA